MTARRQNQGNERSETVNGDRTFGKPIPDGKLSDTLNILYNKWFIKWRNVEMTDEAYDQMIAGLDVILKDGEEYPLVRFLCLAFLYELDARHFGGYTETTARKVLDVIKEGVT